MEALYHETNLLIQETKPCFQRLEQLRGGQTDELENWIEARIETVLTNCERLDVLVHKEPVSRRQNARLRVEQLKYDCQHLRAALENHRREAAFRHRAMMEREELLARRFTRNEDTAILIDHSVAHNTALEGANRGVDELISSGSSILENMRNQRNALKGAHRRIMDVANTLGLSNTTMRLIEKRASEDKYILIGGMIITTVIIVLGIIYLA